RLPHCVVVNGPHDGAAVDGREDRLPETDIGKLRALEIEAVEPDGGKGLEAGAPVLLGGLVDPVSGDWAPVHCLATEGGISTGFVTVEVDVDLADVRLYPGGRHQPQHVVV